MACRFGVTEVRAEVRTCPGEPYEEIIYIIKVECDIDFENALLVYGYD